MPDLARTDPNWVVVGRLGRTRGRVGEFTAHIDSNQPGRAERIQTALLRLSTSGKPVGEKTFEVERVWFHDGRPIFKFQGIDSISEAEVWEGAEMLVPAEDRVRAEPGEYLHSDLIGCSVESAGAVIGEVEFVDEFGGPPILRLKTPAGKELLIPFVRALCQDIDVEAKRIRVELPEGLTEL
ncbi:MAG: ribosome maturation factor RimM [Acidobacteriota bacterium]